ncbi:MAG TPA: hypothetical protein VG270_03195 [Pseudolabrys sp.]|jgi:hypothetical protein|nr:hypothetical protein [Pseudolabrys sp.]
MATIGALFDTSEFGPETVDIMASAYEKARKSLHDKGQPLIVQEVIAARIIAAARSGERDPDKLCRMALSALGHKIEFPD